MTATNDAGPRAAMLQALTERIRGSPRVVAQSRLLERSAGSRRAWPEPAFVGAARHKVAQRMVAIASRDMSVIDDALILNNLDYALGQFGGPIGDFNANRKFDQTRPGDRVGIVAHGSPGKIGNYDARGVADALTKTPGPINEEVASVVLYSCNAGMDQKGPETSLVHGLSSELKARGYEIGVEGQKGIGFGFRGIGERTTKGTEDQGDKAWFSVRDRLLKKPAYSSWRSSGGGFVTADELLQVADNLSAQEVGHMGLEEKAAKVGAIMAPFWREVETEMGGDLYEHLKGWVRVKSYVAGGKLVQDSR